MSDDPVIRAHRAQIAALDLGILEALNARITLVQRLRAHKEARGLGFYDAAQEARLLADLCRANHGPLSEKALRDIFQFILDRTKPEAVRGPSQAE